MTSVVNIVNGIAILFFIEKSKITIYIVNLVNLETNYTKTKENNNP